MAWRAGRAQIARPVTKLFEWLENAGDLAGKGRTQELGALCVTGADRVMLQLD